VDPLHAYRVTLPTTVRAGRSRSGLADRWGKRSATAWVKRSTTRAEFEQDVPSEAPIMQVPSLMWSELVSHGADSSESGGCNERQPFRDWDIGHGLTVRLSAPRLHRFAGGQNRRAMVLLECA
jgi:hypothetical protein